MYRSAFIYGQGACAEYLQQSIGLSVSDFTFVGFALMSVYHSSHVLYPHRDLSLIHTLGVSREALQLSLQRLACPIATLRQEASALRATESTITYRPSIFRLYPCVLLGPRHNRMIAPLPELIAYRVTNGLFYDVISGGGPVRADSGRRFEEYCYRTLEALLSTLHFEREWRYQTRRGGYNSPDILMTNGHNSISLVIECKAARMGVSARFGEDPSGERGYDEIARGVFQLWRFFAHCRRGLTGREISESAQGLVLTLDDWLVCNTRSELRCRRRSAP